MRLPEDQWLSSMQRVLRPDQILGGAAVLRAYDCDAYTVDRNKPAFVVLPESTEEVLNIVRWCLEHEVPFTARGAGTGLSGGAMPALGGVVVSTKRMNRILSIDLPNRRLRAETGTVNVAITAAVAKHGLHFAPDPSSQSVSTLGGNIAENSGGPHTLKYGVTAPHILGLTVVTGDGELLELGGGARGSAGPDLISLMIGAEGLMGIITEAWVKLTPLPEHVETALVSFGSTRDATTSVSQIIAGGAVPAALEIMDRNILKALNAAFGLEYPAGTEALLLVECDGSKSSATKEIGIVESVCRGNNCLQFEVAKDESERKKMWLARKKGIGAMGRLAPSIVTHDGVIPPSKLPEMLDFVYEVAGESGVGVANLFHAGDGNLHPCFYFDDRDPSQVQAVVDAGTKIIARCIELGGSVTGEHGIGVEKLDLMKLMFSQSDLAAQALCRNLTNTAGLCNPCKVIPDQKGCVEHMRRWRGVAT